MPELTSPLFFKIMRFLLLLVSTVITKILNNIEKKGSLMECLGLNKLRKTQAQKFKFFLIKNSLIFVKFFKFCLDIGIHCLVPAYFLLSFKWQLEQENRGEKLTSVNRIDYRPSTFLWSSRQLLPLETFNH